MTILSNTKTEFLPFALPDIGEEEIAEVVDSLRSGWLTTGPKVHQFESDFRSYLGVPEAVAVNSATSGLHLALEAADVGAGDKVITTTNTFTATAEVIRYLDADPILVDIDPLTLNIDLNQVREALEHHGNIKAMIPVHFAGQSCDMAGLMQMAEEFDVKVIEDAAHAFPASYDGRMIGTWGDFTVYSFYATKTLATGEGGMVVMRDPSYAQRMKTMRLHGIDRDVHRRYNSNKPSWYYEVVAPGYKYNMTDVAASLGIHQLRKAERFQKRREEIAYRYTEAFADLPMRTPYVARADDIHAWHLYVIQLELDQLQITRDRFIELLMEKGIGTSVHFIPLHLHPYWRDRYNLKPRDFPVAYDVYQRAVSLPIYTKMSDEDVKRVIAAVRSVIMENVEG